MREDITSKKKLKKIDWNIVRKIIVLLRWNGAMKRSKIAMHCKMNYNCCSLYLTWCMSLQLIKFWPDNEGSELIVLSDRGMELYKEEFAQEQLESV